MITQMAARRLNISEDDLAVFLCVQEVISEDECVVGSGTHQGRNRQRGLVLNTL